MKLSEVSRSLKTHTLQDPLTGALKQSHGRKGELWLLMAVEGRWGVIKEEWIKKMRCIHTME